MKQLSWIRFPLLLLVSIGSANILSEEAIAQQQQIPTDIEVFNILVAGREWTRGGPEACSRYRWTFSELDGNYSYQGDSSYFRKEEGEWVYRGSGSAVYFDVENNFLTFTIGRPRPNERRVTHHRIAAASEDEIALVDESGQGFSYFNCMDDMN